MSMVLFLAAASFLAGLIDSMAGGGGLITLPALLASGIPPHLALGTNKIQSSLGTTFSAGRYLRHGHLHLPTAVTAAAAALLGSYLGSQAALALSTECLSRLLPWLIVAVGAITFLKKDFGAEPHFGGATPFSLALAVTVGLVLGFYDGFFGPGTGTFMAFAFVFLFGFDFIQATANTKLVNLASNVAAAVSFWAAGSTLWQIALPMAAANVTGNWIGAGLAMKGGARVIKPVFGVVLVGLLVKLILQQEGIG